jgi:hypothetical protein
MIEISDTKALYQLEEGGFKASIYFDEPFAEAFLAMKKKAKETGCKIGLTLIVEKADVQPLDKVILSDLHEDLARIQEKIEGHLKPERCTKCHYGIKAVNAGEDGHTEYCDCPMGKEAEGIAPDVEEIV